MQIDRNKDRWDRSNIDIIIKQKHTNRQTNKQTDNTDKQKKSLETDYAIS